MVRTSDLEGYTFLISPTIWRQKKHNAFTLGNVFGRPWLHKLFVSLPIFYYM